MQALLDLTHPINVRLLEETVQSLLRNENVAEADRVLSALKEHPEAYLYMDTVLDQSQCPNTKFFAFQVLELAILTRWHVLPPEQRQGIRDYIVGFIVRTSNDPGHNDTVLSKADGTLVSIAKREWPQKWPTFVQEVVQSCTHGERMASNSLLILRMLAEEIFQEGGERHMTSRWLAKKKATLSRDVTMIMDACLTGLQGSPGVVRRALETIVVYLPIANEEIAFHPALHQALCRTLNSPLRQLALRSLTEVMQLTTTLDAHRRQVQLLLQDVLAAATVVLPPVDATLSSFGHNLYPQLLELHRRGDDEAGFVEVFVQFLAAFFAKQLNTVTNTEDDCKALNLAARFVLGATYLDDKETFKMCIETWWHVGDFMLTPRPVNGAASAIVRRTLQTLFTSIREALVKRMAKPEEVIICQDEHGDLQQVYMNDVESLQLYASMRETLIFFTHLGPRDMEQLISQLMARQLDHSEFSWASLNAVSWAVGSMSGALAQDHERTFFVACLKDLLKLCEGMHGKDNRAVVASNVMYVVGQYPRFLANHVRFFSTVIYKVFQFMKETFPGVPDMAVDTFLKLAKRCGAVFWDERNSIAMNIFRDIDTIASDLKQRQIHIFYEAVGCILAAAPPQVTASAEAIELVLATPNSRWQNLVTRAASVGFDSISTSDDISVLLNTLETYWKVAKTSGPSFIHQMKLIYWDMQSFFASCSTSITAAIQQHGIVAAQYQHVRNLRRVRREILRVVEHFIENAADTAFIAEHCVPSLFSAILTDYQQGAACIRDPQVLAVVTAAVRKLGRLLDAGVPTMVELTFEPTVALITANPVEYPEHRVNLFRLIQALNAACFDQLLAVAQAKPDVIQGILWAMKHTEKETMLCGLETMSLFIEKVAVSSVADAFFQYFFMTILIDTFVCMLDKTHAQGFKQQCRIAATLFAISGTRQTDPNCCYGPQNVTTALLEQMRALPALTEPQAREFIQRCYGHCGSQLAFTTLVADFLVEVDVWGATEENALLEEAERRDRELAMPDLVKSEAGDTTYSYLRGGGELVTI